MKKIAFHTLGCKLNFSETSTLARTFREGEYEIVDFKEPADIYVINTCSVTGTAEKKCRLAIRQAHHRNPDASIAVVGCFSQLKPEEIAKLEGVDIILGSNDKFSLPELLSDRFINTSAHQHISTSEHGQESFIPSYSSNDRTRSFVKVQDGCDYYCSYCTIPFARGKSRSGSIANVMDTVSEALLRGMKEIILTGVNVGDFGKNTNENFYELLQELNRISRVDRIRISSVEPDLLTDEIIELVASSQKLLPHFHIPLQSGSDKILRLMKRRYPVETFRSRVLKIKNLLPHACIAADVIVGFPGESDEDFMETYKFINSLPISYVHVFSYSSRPGTLASKLTDQVKGSVIRERSHRLQHLSDQKKNEFNESCRGLKVKVLFESDNHKGYMHGFTENYIQVKTPFNPALVNAIIEVDLAERSEDGCYLLNN
ncbi:MAG: tRNA (N(6)-L-threonylcarbamoyladenosine(37)-C(2))-methylthiotransferase MtaB [Bacteroidales bacterium]